MDNLIVGFWGAFFGTAVLVGCGVIAAYAAGLRLLAFLGAVPTVLLPLLVVSYLGWCQMEEGDLRMRVHAMVFIGCAAMFGHLMIAMIAHVRDRAFARKCLAAVYGFAGAVAALGWIVPAADGFVIATVGGFMIGGMALLLGIRRAQRGDRLAGVSIVSVVMVCICIAALTRIAMDEGAPWPVHAAAAVSGMAYLAMHACVLWMRFSYLLELRRVVSYGAAYDPVTRMRRHSETGQMVGMAFYDRARGDSMLGVVVVTIGNLLALDKLHGTAAANHGLFVTAGRLRRTLAGGFDVGRLGDDAFLVLARNLDDVRDLERLVQLGHEIVERLSRPVRLSTSADPGQLESGAAHWVAQVGVGIVLADGTERPSEAIAQARSMSKAAWGFPSRVAWRDHKGKLAEAPSPGYG